MIRSFYIIAALHIHFDSGKLTIDWKSDNRIYMTGPVSDIQEVNIEI